MKERDIENMQVSQSATKAYKSKMLFRTVLIIIGIVLAFLLGLYGTSAIAANSHGFIVKTQDIRDYLDTSKKLGAISLCEHSDFETPTTMLYCDGVSGITCISELWIPDDVTSKDGVNNGKDYIAYTFYAKNVGTNSCYFDEKMSIVTSLKQVDSAVRIRLYRDGDYTTYARMASNGKPEYGTTPFIDELTAVHEKYLVEPGQIKKYTLVVYLDGNDPECTSDIQGGQLSLAMEFNVIQLNDVE